MRMLATHHHVPTTPHHALLQALESIGIEPTSKVRCFCYNTAPPTAPDLPPKDAADGPVDSVVEAERLQLEAEKRAWAEAMGDKRGGATGASMLQPDGETPQDTPPVECDGMEGALHYYNQLPPHIFRSARGSASATGFAHAVRYATSLAQADAARGALLSLVILVTPGACSPPPRG